MIASKFHHSTIRPDQNDMFVVCLASGFEYSFRENIIICEVIWDYPAYGGANSVFLYQPFPYVNIHRLFLNCAEREKSHICRS